MGTSRSAAPENARMQTAQNWKRPFPRGSTWTMYYLLFFVFNFLKFRIDYLAFHRFLVTLPAP